MESIKDIFTKLKSTQSKKQSQQELFNTDDYSKNGVIINDKHKYITKEYQYYGLHLAGKLEDKKRATMYIKWAKEKPRVILEKAYSFAIDYPNAKTEVGYLCGRLKNLRRR